MEVFMRRIRLSMLLVGINVALLLIAVLVVALVAVSLLGELADQQALARVAQAEASAQNVLGRSADDLVVSAQVLAQRPTLSRLLQARDTADLAPYLHSYCGASQLSGCAVSEGGQLTTSDAGAVPGALPWPSLLAHWPAGETRLLYDASDGVLTLGARATVSTVPGAMVYAARRLDATYTHELSAQIALPVTILDRAAVAHASGAQGAVLRQAFTHSTTVTARLSQPDVYLAAQAIRAPDGVAAGALVTTLSAAATNTLLRQIVQRLLLLTLAMVALSAGASFLVGRRLGGPLQRLTSAAARIGRGDLDTRITPASGAEIGTLAATLEEMRARLLRLTGDLRRQQAEAQAIVTGIVEGVFTVDSERRIRYLNPQAAALLGITPEQAIGRFCGDALNPQLVDGARPCAERCPIIHARFRGGAHATEQLILPGGVRRSVVITSAAPAEEQQVQVMRDETEVEATRRLRDTVLANISHEFKTPLAAQLASLELLLDQLPDLTGDEIELLVRAQQRGALRLTQLIDNLLESVRIEAGQDSIRQQTVALDAVIAQTVETMRPLMAQRGQTARIDLPAALPPIQGDGPRLTQVFINLLANASKFAPTDSTIDIGGLVSDTGATVKLWVEDEGPGLPSVAGQALFARFVRANSGEPEQSGVGLGLWIVKSIIERHGGTVEAREGGPGARISVALPVGRGDEP